MCEADWNFKSVDENKNQVLGHEVYKVKG